MAFCQNFDFFRQSVHWTSVIPNSKVAYRWRIYYGCSYALKMHDFTRRAHPTVTDGQSIQLPSPAHWHGETDPWRGDEGDGKGGPTLTIVGPRLLHPWAARHWCDKVWESGQRFFTILVVVCQNTTKLAIQLGKVKGNHCVRIICTSSALTEMKRAQCGDLTSRANDKCIFLSKVVLVLAFVLNSQRKRFLIPFESRLIVLLALRPLWLKYKAWTQSL